jgi:hypothetical protein
MRLIEERAEMSETYTAVSEGSPISEDINVVRNGLGHFNRETSLA